MKTILTLLIGFFLITTTTRVFAQKSTKEPVKDSVTISIPATVVLNHHGKMLITDRYNKRHFEIQSTREISQGKEYEFILQFKISDRQKKHCIGCTGILPATLIGFTITPYQAKLDQARIRDALRNKGNNKSPRYQ